MWGPLDIEWVGPMAKECLWYGVGLYIIKIRAFQSKMQQLSGSVRIIHAAFMSNTPLTVLWFLVFQDEGIEDPEQFPVLKGLREVMLLEVSHGSRIGQNWEV
jgi:hypothetical protein